MFAWDELDEPLGANEAFLSSIDSSRSSCLGFLLLLLLEWELSGGRWGPSFVLRAVSESGDLEVLVEADGAERLPERRGSRGESGGPIAEACVMISTGFLVGKRRDWVV